MFADNTVKKLLFLDAVCVKTKYRMNYVKRGKNMKRIICLLLLVCTLLTAFPVLGVAAEETLPKDETPGDISEEAPQGAHSFTDYDALYVGADGSKTANGGSLIGLYTAYGDDATVDIAGGKWKNKMDATGATDAVLRDTSDAVSFVKEQNGFGYHMTADQITAEKTKKKLGVTLPDAWAMLDAFTVESTARLDGIETDKSLSAKASGIRLDTLHCMWLSGMKNMSGNSAYCMRWSALGVWPDFTGNLFTDYAYREVHLKAGKATPIVAAYTKNCDKSGNVSYLVSYNTGTKYTSAKSFSPDEIAAFREEGKANTMPVFSLFNGMSGTFYAVRVYNAPLTEAEKTHNAVVDKLAIAGADLTAYKALDDATRAAADSILVADALNEDKATVDKAVADVLDSFKIVLDINQTMYVTKGLTFFAAAFNGLDSGYNGTDTISWTNALDPKESASLKGGFFRNENGGFTVIKSNADFNKNKQFGIYMPASALPTDGYTVELVYNPFGLSVTGEDGTLERYIDTVSSSGNRNNTMGFAIGPLRAAQYACYRTPGATSGQMDKRWYYSADKDLGQLNWKGYTEEKSWRGLEPYEVVSYAITHTVVDNASTYNFYNNAEHLHTYKIGADLYKTTEEAGNKFQLAVGLAGTAYSIRVYDRALTEEEIAQNKLADVAYYLGLDMTSVRSMAERMGDDAGVLYMKLAELSFTLDKEEAQEALEKMVSSIWFSFEGMGVRKGSDTDAIRYYFDYTPAAVNAMVKTGYTVELGVVVRVGGDLLPTLEGDDYDYKLLAYDGVAGRNTPFFADEDTFAVTVRYDNADKATGLARLLVRGYILLIDQDGNETVYYVDVADENSTRDSLFAVYHSMMENQGIQDDAPTLIRIKETSEKCYEKRTVYVDAAAPAGGDGTKDTPFHSFAAGFAKSKEILASLNVPTRLTLLLADGEYGIYEDQELSGTDMPYLYSSFAITSANGNTTLTTAKEIAPSFTKHADNVWVMQLAKENGEYPCFRNLYVDGKLADLSYSGARATDGENVFISKFDRIYDTPWSMARELYLAGRLTKDSACDYPADRTDLIAAFEGYKEQYLALSEVNRRVADKTLTPESVPTDPNASARYLDTFRAFTLERLALEEMKERFYSEVIGGTSGARESKFKQLEAKNYEGSAEYGKYCEVFVALRDRIVEEDAVDKVSAYTLDIASNSIEKAKYYLHEDLVGDLRAEMAAGRERQKAAYDALKKKYDAATAEEKAELEEALAAAAERVGIEWYRYALEGYGPEMHLCGQWYNNIIHVAGVDYEDVAIDDNGDTHVAIYLELDEYLNYQIRNQHSLKNRYVHMKDALSYVDSENEYYYDELSGKLYYYSEDGTSGKRFARGTHDYMFVFRGVKNVTLSDLYITGVDDDHLSHNDGCTGLCSTGATGTRYNNAGNNHSYDRSAILLDSCFGLTVSNCAFEELGARGIFGRGKIENLTVEGCRFVNLGGGALQIGSGTKERNWSPNNYAKNILITDNYVHDVAKEYFSTAAIWLSYGRNVTITHNTVDRCSYSAICVGFTYSAAKGDPSEEFCVCDNVEIAYNYVTGFMHELGDGGGIYVSGANALTTTTHYFNSIHHNYILMSNITGDGLGHMTVGIYFDGCASNWKCNENVIAEYSYGAVAGEDDALAKEGDPYIVALRKRYASTTFIYMQHISSQLTHNNLLDGNYILNVRAEKPADQHKEVYKTYIVADRNIIERNTHYVNSVDRIPAGGEDIIYGAGCYGHTGDPEMLYDNNY